MVEEMLGYLVIHYKNYLIKAELITMRNLRIIGIIYLRGQDIHDAEKMS